MIARVLSIASMLALVLVALPGRSAPLAPAPAEEGCGEPEEAADKGGCCSHHNGVCGCSGGRAVCCDQTISRTCGC